MSIKYAYLKEHTWLYRRNYPEDVAMVLGSRTLKQSLKTSDTKTARARVQEVNLRFEAIVRDCRHGIEVALAGPSGATSWGEDRVKRLRSALSTLDLAATPFIQPSKRDASTVGPLVKTYLDKRSNELQHGGFKSVRYSLTLFSSHFAERAATSLSREDGKDFLSLIGQLATVVGKSEASRGLTLTELVAFSRGKEWTSARTQRRTWSQVCHFLDWCDYEGELSANAFKAVRLVTSVKLV